MRSAAFSGLWVGLKTMKDTVEATAVVDGNPHRMAFVTPGVSDARRWAEHPAGDTPSRKKRG
jgi:indolepyruvate ferredoxin oxidoreductase